MLYRSVKITNAARMHLALKYFVLSYYFLFYLLYVRTEHRKIRYFTRAYYSEVCVSELRN